jgi:hypothetical protein
MKIIETDLKDFSDNDTKALYLEKKGNIQSLNS